MITTTRTLHAELHAFLRAEVTGWGIPIRGIPRPIRKDQKSNPDKRARTVALRVRFLTCFIF